jgi:acyl dehydratase
LLGDLNPLHADPAVSLEAGYRAPILHGLCTFGFVARALVSGLCRGEPARLRALSGQFLRPAFPGDALTCDVWRQPDRIRVRARVDDGGEVLANAWAEVIPEAIRTSPDQQRMEGGCGS